MRGPLAALRDGLLDLVFAPVCAGCGNVVPTAEGERLVCRACWSRARAIPPPRCERCWAPAVPGRSECGECESIPPGIRVVRSAYLMGEEVRALVHALKYRGWSALAAPMARRMAGLPLPADVEEEARLVVPVPTSRVRLRERGYNQAGLLAEELAAATGRRADAGVLVRERASGTQTTLHPGERRANVAGAFAVPAGRESAVAGEHVLLVDDVWTTGATAAACADALLEAGARVVSVVTFARVVPALER